MKDGRYNQNKDKRPALSAGKGKKDSDTGVDKGVMLLHQLVPYILVVFALFLLLCFVTYDFFGKKDALGIVGAAVRNFSCGLFGVTAYVIPFLLGYLGIRWNRFNSANTLRSKTVFTFLTIIDLGAVVHVFYISARPEGAFGITNLGGLYASGKLHASAGIIGGLFGEISYALLNVIGTSVVGIALLIVYIIFLIGISPTEAWNKVSSYVRYVRERARINKENSMKEAQRKEEEKAEKRERERIEFEEKIREENERKRALEEEKRQRALDKKLKEEAERAERERIAAEAEADSEESGFESYTIESAGVISVADEKDKDTEKKKRGLIGKIFDAAGEEDEALDSDETDLEKIFVDPCATTENSTNEPLEVQTIALKRIAQEDIGADGVQLGDGEGEHEETREERTERLSKLDARGDDIIKYTFPPFNLLKVESETSLSEAEAELKGNADILMRTFANFKVGIKEISYSRGPTITRYELLPDSGTRIRTIANLVDDIGLALATSGIRMEAPIPNKSLVGIEVPNKVRANVYARPLIESDAFQKADSRLWACLGKDVAGTPVFFDIAKMPHMLIAGATGMGKSVCINSILVSLLYKARPDEVKLILIDPKKVEFSVYNGIPHLLVPVVTDPKKSAGTLKWAVDEMERRFELIESVNVRDIKTYNAITAGDPEKEFMPHIVIVIDELADLMMTAADEVESHICRLAQKARAAGIHIIIGTQRPSVDVITGLIKANIPSRIAFTVASQIDSRTILDTAGAEKLIGKGDMLFNPVGAMKPIRVQGAFISEEEVINITNFIKHNSSAVRYDDDVISSIEEAAAMCGQKKSSAAQGGGEGPAGEADPLFRTALEIAVDSGSVATSMLQRNINVGYGRAARLIDRMEKLKFVSSPKGNKPRDVLITREAFDRMVMENDPRVDGYSK